MPAQLETEVKEPHAMSAEEMAQHVRLFAQEALAALKDRREQAYGAACAPLDAEREALAEEHASIDEAAQSLEQLLPATQRVAQYESDKLLVAGKHEEAAAKLAEAEEAANAPAAMRERQRQISARLEQIDTEKNNALRPAAEDFKQASIALIRGVETSLASILDETRKNLNTLEDQTGATLYLPQQLTAGERTPEWVTLNRLYGGRVR